VSALDCERRTIWIVDANRGDEKRFVVRADEGVEIAESLGSYIMITLTHKARIVEEIRASNLKGRALERRIVELLSELPTYSSNFIYRLKGDTLVLDAFTGEATEHTRIPVGRGVCGTAVAENANQLIEDVSKLENYLCCSLKTKSEIVVLIRRDGEILGQIDIDGHDTGAFDKSDEEFLEEIAAILAGRWE
jgi:GAF domain-containing protein